MRVGYSRNPDYILTLKGGDNKMNITELTKLIVSAQEGTPVSITAKQAKEAITTVLQELASMDEKEIKKLLNKYR